MRTLQPGDLVVDYSFARPDLHQLARDGAKAVIRYSAGAASDPQHESHAAVSGKLIDKAEYGAIVAIVGDIIANDEWTEDRIEGGFAAGHADGLAAGALWASCGHPKGTSIYVSWDTAPARAKFAKVASYGRGYAKALKQYGYLLDGYAGTPFLRFAIKHALYRYGWRPNAGSWSNDGLPYQPDTSTAAKRAALVKLARRKTPAHIWQTGNYWANKSCDEDLIVRVPVGSRADALAAAEPEHPHKHPRPKQQKKRHRWFWFRGFWRGWRHAHPHRPAPHFKEGPK